MCIRLLLREIRTCVPNKSLSVPAVRVFDQYSLDAGALSLSAALQGFLAAGVGEYLLAQSWISYGGLRDGY